MPGGELSEEEFGRWTPLPRALETISIALGNAGSAALALAQRLRAGLLQAAAETAVNDNRPADRVEFALVPPTHWKQEWAANPISAFWRSGQMTVTISHDHRAYSAQTATYFGLRVSPEGLAKMLPDRTSPVISPPVVKSARSNRGRPPKPIWDEMWAEIAARMVHREFLASKQADIEATMMEWLIDHNEDAGESTVRESAARLWKALNLKARKYPQ